MMEALLSREVVVALAVAGAVLSSLASYLKLRGRDRANRARALNAAGYAAMGTSMLLFAMAGLLGVSA